MPVPPEGAQMSPDGNYWWDETNQQWQLAEQGGGAAGGAAGGGAAGTPGQDAGSPLIVFADIQMLTANEGAAPMMGIDPDDNPDNHDVPTTGCGIHAVWADFNAGTADAQGYSDSWTLDPAGGSAGSGTLDNLDLPMGHGTMREVKLGRLEAGHYNLTVTLNNGVSLQQLNFEVGS